MLYCLLLTLSLVVLSLLLRLGAPVRRLCSLRAARMSRPPRVGTVESMGFPFALLWDFTIIITDCELDDSGAHGIKRAVQGAHGRGTPSTAHTTHTLAEPYTYRRYSKQNSKSRTPQCQSNLRNYVLFVHTLRPRPPSARRGWPHWPLVCPRAPHNGRGLAPRKSIIPLTSCRASGSTPASAVHPSWHGPRRRSGRPPPLTPPAA